MDSQLFPAVTTCCEKHDICYDKCNSDKSKCDTDFQTCLRMICKNLHKATGGTELYEGKQKLCFSDFNKYSTISAYCRKLNKCCLKCKQKEILPDFCFTAFFFSFAGWKFSIFLMWKKWKLIFGISYSTWLFFFFTFPKLQIRKTNLLDKVVKETRKTD